MSKFIFKLIPNSRLLSSKRLFIFLAILASCICAPQRSSAHQQPTTIVLLDVSPDNVAMELQIPLSELELAFGHDASKHPNTLVERLSPQLKNYLIAHIHPMSADAEP